MPIINRLKYKKSDRGDVDSIFVELVSSLVKPLVLSAALLLSVNSYALVLSPDFEVQNISGVGAAGVAVTFDNVYADPVPVCTYVIAAITDLPATVRIDGLSGTGMTINLQEADGAVTAGNVQCIIMDEGIYSVANDGFEAEARTIVSDETNGQSDWVGQTEEVTSGTAPLASDIEGSYANPVVLGQVITLNDPAFSVFWSNNCVTFQVAAFDVTDRICVGKHNGKLGTAAQPTQDETLGYIVFEEATGLLNGVLFETERGANSIAGVTPSFDDFYNLNNAFDYDYAVATQTGINGGDGSWAVLTGTDPLANGRINLQVEETDAPNRNHVSEEIDYIAFAAAQLTLEKVVINDNGGVLADSAFTLTATGPIIDIGTGTGTTTSQITQSGVEGDAQITNEVIYPDTYSLSETAIAGYSASAWGCVGGSLAGSNLTMVAGDDVVCTITNDDISPRLSLVKVVNNTVGSAAAGDWTLEANLGGGAAEISGTSGVGMSIDAGAYVLSEINGPAGYTQESLSCDAGSLDAGTSTLTIGLAESVTCTFTNRDIVTDLEIIKTVSNQNPVIGEIVTFMLEVINNGPDDATNLTINDTILSGFTFVGLSMLGGDSQNQTAPNLIWTIDDLFVGSGNAVTLTYQATVNAP